MQHLGLSGRLPASSLLGGLVPVEAQALDFYMAVGGHANSDNGGLSLGVLTGALPSAAVDVHACVPELSPPAAVDLVASTTLETNLHPVTGEQFDLALGVHREFLNRAAWAAHQAGYLCLDIGARQVPLLTASAIAVLAPSLIELLHGEDAPLFLLVRPQAAPEINLGAGTFITDENGISRIDEPLIDLLLRDLEIDWYAFVDQRYVRMLTLVADLRVPIGLEIDGNGEIMPVIGDLTEAFENLRVTNSGLLAEAPADIADKFPAVLSIALPGISDQLSAIALPDLAGLTLALGPDSLTSIDGNAILGIFADLAIATVDEEKSRAPTATTAAQVVSVDGDGGRVELRLGGRAANGGRLEWQVRVDRGFWSPYSSNAQIILARGAFRLQGQHVVEVRAREIGRPETADPQPVVLDFVIDTLPPRLRIEQSEEGASVEAEDLISPRERLAVAYRFGGGRWLDAGAPPVALSAREASETASVRVTDEAGNVSEWRGPVLGFHGQVPDDSSCDCALTGSPERDAGSLLLVALVALGLMRRPRRRRSASALLALFAVAGLLTTSACGSQETADDDDSEPTYVVPGPTGRWASMAADESRVLLAAYEQEYGDLVLAEVSEEGRPEFAVVDGAPAEPVLLDPDDYRGGVVAPGANVGAWTSIGLAGGRAGIAYQDLDRGSLRFTLEVDGAWAAHEVDVGGDETDAGMYASLSFDADGVPGIAYMAVMRVEVAADEGAEPAGEELTAELRWAQALTASPASADDWTIEIIATATVAVDPDFEDVPVGTGLFASAAHRSNGQAVVAYYDQVAADLQLATRDGGEWAIAALDASEWDRGQWASLAVAADDTVHVVYQDSNREQLLAISQPVGGAPSGAEIVDDARRGEDRPHAVGGSARLLIAPNGEPVVAYQDGTTSDLLVARRGEQGGWASSELFAGEVGYGFYIGAAVAGDEIWVSTYAYDQSSWPPGHTEVRRVR